LRIQFSGATSKTPPQLPAHPSPAFLYDNPRLSCCAPAYFFAQVASFSFLEQLASFSFLEQEASFSFLEQDASFLAQLPSFSSRTLLFLGGLRGFCRFRFLHGFFFATGTFTAGGLCDCTGRSSGSDDSSSDRSE
jgi:hypothetical protein